jgi:PPOX class probable FMN-dependent enzyme
MSSHDVTTLEQLRDLYGHPGERAVRKQRPRLDDHCRRLIELSPLVLLATASDQGDCDVSPKGGPPGFVEVIDDTHLAIGDASGNKRLDGLQNILSNPHIGLLFLIPAMRETLRVNGRAKLSIEPELLSGLATGGKPPALAIVVTVEAAYLHCGKAMIRSELWKPGSWPQADELPSAAQILSDHAGVQDVPTTAATLADAYVHAL